MPVFCPRSRSARMARPLIRTETESGISPATTVVSSGNCSLARTATSLRATIPRGWKTSPRHAAISVLRSENRAGNLARHHSCLKWQLLLGPHRYIVARHNPAGLENLAEACGNFGLGGVHTLVEGLHHQIIGVAVHHQGGQQVGLTVHHAIRV